MGEAENKNHTYNHNVHNTHVHNFISFSREFFPPFAGDWALNKGDPNAAQFSRMDEVDNFIGNDGKYNLKYVGVNEKQASPYHHQLLSIFLHSLCYQELNLEDNCYIFDQVHQEP